VALVAASTQDAVSEIAASFKQESGIEVRLSAASSSRLAAQISEGAPADLFLSANEKWADFVKQKGLALQAEPLLGNTLVLIVPKGAPDWIREPKDLLSPAVKKVALAGPNVPAGMYARQSLAKLGVLDPLESQNRIVPGESVRATLTYVERGEVQAGVVFGTDARIADRVEIRSTFPPDSHDPIVYPLVLLRRAGENPAARTFYDYLRGPTAAGVFRKYGFTFLPSPAGNPEGERQQAPAWPLSAREWQAVGLSLLVSVTATVAGLPFGIALGYFLARRDFPGKSAVETAVSLPLVLPPVVTGFLLLLAFGQRGWLGHFLASWLGIHFVFDWKGAALASAVVSFPLMVRIIRVAFGGIDSRLEFAARTLGAGPWETFFRISLPLARRGILAGAALAFARSLGEFGATVVIAGNIPGQTQTIPLYIYSQIDSPGGMENSAPLVVLSILIAAAALGLAEWLARGREPAGHAPNTPPGPEGDGE
jgi:molybdate transport system permease protein